MKFTSPYLLLSYIALTVASPLAISVVDKESAPLLSTVSAAEHEIPNSYIIVLKDGVKPEQAEKHHAWVKAQHHTSLKKRSLFSKIESLTGLKHTFDLDTVRGYAGTFDESVVDEIRRHPDVEYVEKDSMVYALEEPKTQNSAPWGLARLSHREALDFGSFNKYIHQAEGGANVDVYVIDTGTNIKHVDFEGRATWGKTIPQGDADIDGNGHGTHCSGTVGGKKYGVSKKANIIAIKVLRSNGSGTMSDVVKGVEYAAKAHKDKVAKKDAKFKGSAANMSLGGGSSPTLDRAVNGAVKAGINFAVAAGNDNADACNYSPAAAANAVTVGASTISDDRAYFSNYGKCVDIFAPGLNIQSTWIGSDHAINTISGTSMASPHVAGLLAYFLSLAPDSDSDYAVGELTPAKLKKNVIAIASKGALDGIPEDTVNLLAWNGGGSSDLNEIFGKGASYTAPSKSSSSPKASSKFASLHDKVEGFVKEVTKDSDSLLKDLEDDIVSMIEKARKNLA